MLIKVLGFIFTLSVIGWLLATNYEPLKPQTPSTSNCGFTSFKNNGREFYYSCGLEEFSKHVVDKGSANLDRDYLCKVLMAQGGKLGQIRCKEDARPELNFIESNESISGLWTCKGLDGFGGYNSNREESLLQLNNEGGFALKLKAKSNSDSIWYARDSVISGEYQIGQYGKLKLSPKNWDGKLIAAAGLTLDDGPEFMLTKPVVIELETLTKESLDGAFRWLDNPGHVVTYVNCKKSTSSPQ